MAGCANTSSIISNSVCTNDSKDGLILVSLWRNLDTRWVRINDSIGKR